MGADAVDVISVSFGWSGRQVLRTVVGCDERIRIAEDATTRPKVLRRSYSSFESHVVVRRVDEWAKEEEEDTLDSVARGSVDDGARRGRDGESRRGRRRA